MKRVLKGMREPNHIRYIYALYTPLYTEISSSLLYLYFVSLIDYENW